jgi:hypothetical protein
MGCPEPRPQIAQPDDAAFGEKVCTKCGRVRPVGQFHKRNRSRDGLEAHCKTCMPAKKRDKCPRCGESKQATSNVCMKCRYLRPRPEIEQPAVASLRLVPLTQEQVAIVDADCYEQVAQWNWHAEYNGEGYYAVRRGRSGEPKRVYLHRQLAGEPSGEVDHINGNTLDNRLQNLRACTSWQNKENKGLSSNCASAIIGVYQYKNKWRAQIYANGKQIHLGTFNTKEAAIAARVFAEMVYFGEFAPVARDLITLPPGLFDSLQGSA